MSQSNLISDLDTDTIIELVFDEEEPYLSIDVDSDLLKAGVGQITNLFNEAVRRRAGSTDLEFTLNSVEMALAFPIFSFIEVDEGLVDTLQQLGIFVSGNYHDRCFYKGSVYEGNLNEILKATEWTTLTTTLYQQITHYKLVAHSQFTDSPI